MIVKTVSIFTHKQREKLHMGALNYIYVNSFRLYNQNGRKNKRKIFKCVQLWGEKMSGVVDSSHKYVYSDETRFNVTLVGLTSFTKQSGGLNFTTEMSLLLPHTSYCRVGDTHDANFPWRSVPFLNLLSPKNVDMHAWVVWGVVEWAPQKHIIHNSLKSF